MRKYILVFIVLSLLSCWDANAGKIKSGVVNINTATLEQLKLLPRVGAKTAQRIIKARPFNVPADIMRVRGIKKKKFAKMEKFVVVVGETTAKGKQRKQRRRKARE